MKLGFAEERHRGEKGSLGLLKKKKICKEYSTPSPLGPQSWEHVEGVNVFRFVVKRDLSREGLEPSAGLEGLG